VEIDRHRLPEDPRVLPQMVVVCWRSGLALIELRFVISSPLQGERVPEGRGRVRGYVHLPEGGRISSDFGGRQKAGSRQPFVAAGFSRAACECEELPP